jgi:NAD+ synthase
MTGLSPRLPPHARASIEQFLRAHVRQAGARGVVVGLSGGIDSALCARLAVDALGAERVLGRLLPDAAFPAALRTETEAYARSLGIEARTAEIEPIERAVERSLGERGDRIGAGNVKARLRMVLLYATAHATGTLVLGTGNKSELLVGYFTKYGDGGVDLLPIGDLYKTQVRLLAEELALPAPIRERPPTAGLWEGQTDEEEMGIRYADLDPILHGLERLMPEAAIAEATGLPIELVRDVAGRVERNRHKRRAPPIPKIGLRTIGLDWRD